MPVRAKLDTNRDFAAARGFTFLGVDYSKGDPFPKDAATARQLRTLYDSRTVDHAPDAPAEPQDDGGVTVEATGGGWYDVKAPWLDEPVRARGKGAADERAAELRAAGEPDDHHGVALTAGENGWYEVRPEWADEAEKVHGEAAARERAAQLRADGPPPAEPPALDAVEGIAASVLVHVEDDGFAVSAPWLDAVETFETAEQAEARQAELREAGPPEGWEDTPPAAD